MYNIIIAGSGKIYSEYLNLIKYQELMGEINVVALTIDDNFTKTLDGYKIVDEKEGFNLDFDYCLVANRDFLGYINEATEFGVDKSKFIPIKVLAIPNFNFSEYVAVKTSNISIISSNCFGGIVYNTLGLEFLSPTIDLNLNDTDFIKLANNLEYYLSKPVEFVKPRYEDDLNRFYPVGKIEDISIHFTNYTSFEEATEFWDRRKERVNFDNLFFVAHSDDEEIIANFDKIQHENKLIFVSKETKVKSAFCVDREFRSSLDYETGAMANLCASGDYPALNIISLLNKKKDFTRINNN